jgi:hypothetical protein
MQEVYLYKKPGSARVAGNNTMQQRLYEENLQENKCFHSKIVVVKNCG